MKIYGGNMSAWRLVVKELYRHGGWTTSPILSDQFAECFDLKSAITQAKKFGLIENCGRWGMVTVYSLTDLGYLFAAKWVSLEMVGATNPPRRQYCFKLNMDRPWGYLEQVLRNEDDRAEA